MLIHLYYFFISITFCYVYYHKFQTLTDFYSFYSSGGIYPVMNLEAVKPVQFRILVPFIFKALKTIFDLVHSIPDAALFFLMTIGFCYFILLGFYYLLNEYFKSKAANCWLAPIIIYPMIWNFVILNGQFFYMDFTVLLFIILGFYAMVAHKKMWMLVIFFFGVFNHPSVGYLIPAYLLFNYNRLLKKDTIVYTVIMAAMYIGLYKFMDNVFPKTVGYFIIYNLPRNLKVYEIIKVHIIIRDLIFNFGGLHFIVIALLFGGLWKRFRGPMLYINLVIIPYVISVAVNFSIEEMRNYIAVIPFVVITALLFLSSFENSFLKPVDRVMASDRKN